MPSFAFAFLRPTLARVLKPLSLRPPVSVTRATFTAFEDALPLPAASSDPVIASTATPVTAIANLRDTFTCPPSLLIALVGRGMVTRKLGLVTRATHYRQVCSAVRQTSC